MVRLEQMEMDHAVLVDMAKLLKELKAIGHASVIKETRKAASPSRKAQYLALLLFFRCHAAGLEIPDSVATAFTLQTEAPNFRRPFLASKTKADDTIFIVISPESAGSQLKKATLDLFAQELDGYWVSLFKKLKI
jgi:hypothetical protein